MYEFEKNKLKAYLGDTLYTDLKAYNCIIAGGTITSLFCNRDINDVDVYFKNTKDLRDFILQCVRGNSNLWIVAKTNKALLLKTTTEKFVQLISFKTFNNAQEIFDTFDFTVCMGAFDCEKEEFTLHHDFLKHNSQRLLMFNDRTAFPIVSALRVDKYKQKGYSISKTEYLRVLLTCMNLKLNKYEELKEQLGGMYGVDYDDVIKPLEGEEFDIGKVIERMSDIINHPDYFNPPRHSPVEIDDWSLLISEMTKEKVPYYEFRGDKYIYGDEGLEKLSSSTYEKLKDNLVLEDLEKDFFKGNLLVYKNVKEHNGKLISNYDNTFEYEVGKLAIAKGVAWDNTPIGLFVCQLHEVNDMCYGGNNSTVIELRLDSLDDILDLEQFTIKQGLVTRIVKQSLDKKN